jgi:hypothetical protein
LSSFGSSLSVDPADDLEKSRFVIGEKLQLLFLLDDPVGVEVPRRGITLLGVELIHRNKNVKLVQDEPW